MDANTLDYQARTLDGVSIHAPVMDANHYNRFDPTACDVSIHAPVMDANCERVVAGLIVMFQSTRP